METPTILNDNREIIKVINPEGQLMFAVGLDGCKSIVAYPEPGQGAYVPWLAIHSLQGIKHRIPVAHCQIEYVDDIDK